MKHSEARKIVALLRAAFPHATIGQDTLDLYTEALADLDYERAGAAAKRIMVTGKFFPSIAEIRQEYAKDAADRSGEDAWGDVLSAISAVGMYRQPMFRDLIVAVAVDRMGWENLCQSGNSYADRARFVELYEHLQLEQQTRRALGRFAPPPPMLRESSRRSDGGPVTFRDILSGYLEHGSRERVEVTRAPDNRQLGDGEGD